MHNKDLPLAMKESEEEQRDWENLENTCKGLITASCKIAEKYRGSFDGAKHKILEAAIEAIYGREFLEFLSQKPGIRYKITWHSEEVKK